jgi:hypothetical protein
MTAAKPEQDLEGLRQAIHDSLVEHTGIDVGGTAMDRIAADAMRLVQAEVAAAEDKYVKVIPACTECRVLGGKHWTDCSLKDKPQVVLYRKLDKVTPASLADPHNSRPRKEGANDNKY